MPDVHSGKGGHDDRMENSNHKLVLAAQLNELHPKRRHIYAENKCPYAPIFAAADKNLHSKENDRKNHHDDNGP